MRVLTSGRWDPPHPSHFCNLIKIAEKYGPLTVVLLDYPKRRFPICYCLNVFNKVLNRTSLDIKFIVNKVHFGKVTIEELNSYGCGIYVGGNLKVLRHIETLGFPVEYIERSFEYTASEIPFPD